jgi:hypothetical protein
MVFLVTVKLPRGHKGPHDPKRKVEGQCPAATGWDAICTDVTGEHHTILVRADSVDEARAWFPRETHITRVEGDMK